MKLIATIFTAVLVTFGAGTSYAGTPEECAESDDVPDGVECPVEGGDYPLLLPEEGTVPDSTTPPAPPSQPLPVTGSDATVSTLQIGGIAVAGGVIVLIAARRRRPAPAA